MTLVARQNFIVCVSVMAMLILSSAAQAQPSIRAIVTPAPNARGWNNTPVTITFACEGTSSCPEPVSLAADGAAQRVTRTAEDAQGAHAEATAIVNIDTRAPVVSALSPASSETTSATATITASARDELSGLLVARCNGEPARLANNTITCTRPLREGANDIIVTTSDTAGNNASGFVRIWRDVEPRTLRISLQNVTLGVGHQRALQALDDSGRTLTDVTWTSADPGVVQASDATAEMPSGVITGVGPGQTTVTATWHELSATVAITVLNTDTPPIGTSLWTMLVTPGFKVDQQVHVSDVGDGASMLIVEAAGDGARYRVTAITQEPRQLWSEWPAIASHERVIRWMGDQTGGALLLLRDTSGPAAIVRIGHPVERTQWRYEPPGRLSGDWAMSWDGTLYVIETPADGFPQIVAIDSATGLAKFRLPVPRSTSTVSELRCALNQARRGGTPLLMGPVTVPDGKAAAFPFVETLHDDQACDASAAGEVRRRYAIKLLRVTRDGQFTVRPLREVTATSRTAPQFAFHLVVPDGQDGLLVPVRTSMADGSVDNRIVRLEGDTQTEYTLPTLGEYVLGEVTSVYKTGNGYIADGHTLIAFDPVQGEVRWTFTPPSGDIKINFAAKGGGVVVDTDEGISLIDASGVRAVVTPPTMHGFTKWH
jgi:outer membrane protein assembly factor BamB